MSQESTRLEQLGNLLTAMIAVVLCGSSDLTGLPRSQPVCDKPDAPIIPIGARRIVWKNRQPGKTYLAELKIAKWEAIYEAMEPGAGDLRLRVALRVLQNCRHWIPALDRGYDPQRRPCPGAVRLYLSPFLDEAARAEIETIWHQNRRRR
jgi:hypothetical protein